MWPPKLMPSIATAPVASSRARSSSIAERRSSSASARAQRAGQLEAARAARVVGLELDPGRDAVVEVRRVGDVAQRGDPIGDVADVGGDAEHLHPDQHGAAAPWGVVGCAR